MKIDFNLSNKPFSPFKSYEKNGTFFKLSGDEYYWQHQNQLQQSHLEFKKLDATLKQPLIWHHLIQTPYAHFTPEKKNSANLSNPILLKETSASNINLGSSVDIFSNPILQILKEPDPCFLSTLHQVEQKASTKVFKLESKTSSTSNPAFYKKHHLFINQREVELTLNTRDLKNSQMREFLGIIKEFIKKKGLLLKKLIINGAVHDQSH